MRLTASIGAILFALGAYGQNLVPNGSFEDFQHCPVSFNPGGFNQLVKNWTQPTEGTSDYYNICSNGAGVPGNVFGNQMAADGEGYIGLITYSPSKRNYREYLQVKLDQPMTRGKQYCVEVWVSQADFSNYLSDGFGMLFTEERVSGQRDRVLSFAPQIENPEGHVIHHVDSWILIADTFRAAGGEQYMTIGNFRPDHELNIMRRNLEKEGFDRVWDHAYYYIDNLSVKPLNEDGKCECTVSEIRKMLEDPGYPFTYVEMKSVTISSVYFDFDKDVLTKEYTKDLDKVVRMMKKFTSYYLTVHGHTDKIGEGDYNEGLSKRRAEHVYEYLKKKGIDEKRLRIEFHGEQTLIAEGDNAEAHKKNRRVEFELLQL